MLAVSTRSKTICTMCGDYCDGAADGRLWRVLDPQGPIGAAEKLILLNALGTMLAVVLPTMLATLGVAWWFRASNAKAQYRPRWAYSGRIQLVIWSIPAMVVILVGGIGVCSHDLDPPKPISSDVGPIEVQVIAMPEDAGFIWKTECHYDRRIGGALATQSSSRAAPI